VLTRLLLLARSLVCSFAFSRSLALFFQRETAAETAANTIVCGASKAQTATKKCSEQIAAADAAAVSVNFLWFLCVCVCVCHCFCSLQLLLAH
jgi:hypothetical protein